MTVVDVKGDVEHSIPLTDVPSQHSYLLELVDNPAGLRAINPA